MKNKQAQLKILQMPNKILLGSIEQAYDAKINKLLTVLLYAGLEDEPDVLNVTTGGNNDDDNDHFGGGSQVQEVNKAGIRYIWMR